MTEDDLNAADDATSASRTGKSSGPTPKGERTRNQILDGAIGVVAARGVGGVTHRSVAREAGVSLSTTTYYFTSLDDLLTQAFLRLITRMQSCPNASVDVFARAVEGASIGPDTPMADRCALRDRLLGAVETYLAGSCARDSKPEHIRSRQQLLRAELRFFFEGAHIDTLTAHLTRRRDHMTEALLPLPQQIGSDNARLDAEMLYDQLLMAVYALRPDRSLVRAVDEACMARFERFFGMMLRL